jgi:DNA-binding LytR/AlgR family response regulator
LIRIAIVDDESTASDQIQDYITRYSNETGVVFSIKEFRDGLSFLSDYKPVYDIVFLDIKMPLLNGFEVSKALYELDKNVCIIFVTNMAQYAVKGYEVDALYFAVKPINYYNLSTALTKALGRIKMQAEKELLLSDCDQLIRLKVSSIHYVEMEKHYAVFHTDLGEFRERTKMETLEEQLSSNGFARCNSGCLVNLKHIQRITKNAVILKDAELPIARPRYKKFVDDFMSYLGGGT